MYLELEYYVLLKVFNYKYRMKKLWKLIQSIKSKYYFFKQLFYEVIQTILSS